MRYKSDADFVADFRLPGGRIHDSAEHASVVRYIQSLEAKIVQLVLENQPEVKPVTNAEAQFAATIDSMKTPEGFTGRYGPDYGPGVAGCSDCEVGRCTMDCSRFSQGS
jgi:hypothetical protein